ncbi:MAG: AarF/ABC1/UbiB kinase family protein [Nanohaloarchaea archaeon]|nr:AarF/ABC1/UbiB kinase family protein [Candidatus Nanohaloarchaea archaeon]
MPGRIEEMERFEHILKVLAEEGFGSALDRMDLMHHVPVARKMSTRQKKPGPERLRETFEELGPAFIKFGQIMSERPDLIPEKYTEELEKLEDSAPKVDYEEIEKIVGDEIGLEKFDRFENEPIASASIAQVHKAVLDGKEVAVKVRRPDIQERMDEDLRIIRYLATKADKQLDIGGNMLKKEAEEFARWTRDELDFEKEARNLERFQKNLEDEEKIFVPDVYTDISTRKVLVMEYVDALKCDNTEAMQDLDVDQKEIARTGLRSFLKQLLRDGFIHVDPHPSNFMVKDTGELVYLDFGMMADISPSMQKDIGMLMIHTYNEDVDRFMNTITAMSTVEEDADLESLRKEVERMVIDLRDAKLEETSISTSLMHIAKTAADKGVYLPTRFVLIGKGLVTMEGIGLKIYPDFEFNDEYQRIVEEQLAENTANPSEISKSLAFNLVENKDLVTDLPGKLNRALEQAGKPDRVKVESQTPDLVVPSLIVGSAIVLSSSMKNRMAVGLGILGLGYASLLYMKER